MAEGEARTVVAAIKGAFVIFSAVAYLIYYFNRKSKRKKRLHQLKEAAVYGKHPPNDFTVQPYFLAIKEELFQAPPKSSTHIFFIALFLFFCGFSLIDEKANTTLAVLFIIGIAFTIGDFLLRKHNYKRGLAIEGITGTSPALLQANSMGMNFSLHFLEPYNYSQALRHRQSKIMLTWADIKSIEETTPEAWSYLFAPGYKRGGSKHLHVLEVTLERRSQARQKWGSKVYISLYLLDSDQQANLVFWLKHYEKNACKL